MKAIQGSPLAEFQIQNPANRLWIENADEEIVIHAEANNFTAGQKASFVHYLAVEGFIPAHYFWADLSSPYARHSVRWLVDPVSSTNGPERNRNERRERAKRIAQRAIVILALSLASVTSYILWFKLWFAP